MPSRRVRATGKVKNTGSRNTSFAVRLYLVQRDLLGDIVEVYAQDSRLVLEAGRTSDLLIIDTSLASPAKYFTTQPGEVIERTVTLNQIMRPGEADESYRQLKRQDFEDYVEPE